MAVKIRLSRRGRKKLAMYDVVIADSRSPRDGRFIEKIGRYNPNENPAMISIDEEKAFQWVMKGAQPTDTVRAMLSYRGVMYRKHLQLGVIKGALTQEEADAKFLAWKEGKDQAIEAKRSSLADQKDAEAKARFEAESKVKEARAEALRKKKEEEAAAAKAESEEAAGDSEAAEEAPADEAAEGDAPAEEGKEG